MHKAKLHRGVVPTVALFASMSTLLCCALPALLVTVGAGATLIGLFSTMPGLVWLSEHKTPLFIFAGVMLTISGTLRYLNRNAPCPADPAQAKACARLRRISSWIFYISVSAYATGIFFAFLAPQMMRMGMM